MNDLFRNKYRIPSARLQNWNYGLSASYFITICTSKHKYFFGDISDNDIILSEIGIIVKKEWLRTFKMRSDMNLQNDIYAIMPNHFHAIITIGENLYNSPKSDTMHNINDYNYPDDRRRDAVHCVSTNKFGPQSKNLASIIRGFKIAVTTNSRKKHPDFAWQTRFHDHIIRNPAEYKRIFDYIADNPKNWIKDKFYDYKNIQKNTK